MYFFHGFFFITLYYFFSYFIFFVSKSEYLETLDKYILKLSDLDK